MWAIYGEKNVKCLQIYTLQALSSAPLPTMSTSPRKKSARMEVVYLLDQSLCFKPLWYYIQHWNVIINLQIALILWLNFQDKSAASDYHLPSNSGPHLSQVKSSQWFHVIKLKQMLEVHGRIFVQKILDSISGVFLNCLSCWNRKPRHIKFYSEFDCDI